MLSKGYHVTTTIDPVLQSYAEDDGIRLEGLAVRAFEFKQAVGAPLDRRNLVLMPDIDLESRRGLVPAAEDRLAQSRHEGNR